MSRTEYLDNLIDGHRERLRRGDRNATAFGHPVRILTVSRTHGLRVRFPDGSVQRAHPEDVIAA